MVRIHAAIDQIWISSLVLASATAHSMGRARPRPQENLSYAADAVLHPNLRIQRANQPFDWVGTRNTPSCRLGRPSLCGSEFSRGRLRTASIVLQRPEQLLQIWQGYADTQRSNLLLFFSRHTEFIIRRCFFPYALVLFALFNIMTVAFWLCVVGANIVWPIALYSCLAFRGGRRPSAAVQQLRALP